MGLESKIEVTLIGTGGGYGESIVIHLGSNNWIVVDSCIDPHTRQSLPLEYLIKRGVDVANDVKAVICTHWHDDHIRGMSQLLKACCSSDFCMARTSDSKKFLLLVSLDYNKAKTESSASSTIELSNCIKIIEERKGNLKTASQDRILYRFNENDILSEVISLSPSDFIMHEFDKEISTLMKDYANPNRKIIVESPNAKSVVLHIRINNKNGILLGSDLEVSNDRRKGWLCILDQSTCISLKSSLFKIPHHGSENGFHEEIWDKLLINNPIAKLTPWNRGSKLPTTDMLKKYNSLTFELYTTLNITSNSPKKRNKSISKSIRRYRPSLREIKFNFGAVRSHLDIKGTSDMWEVECINEATKITNEILKF